MMNRNPSLLALAALLLVAAFAAAPAHAEQVVVPLSRSEMIRVPSAMAEVVVANPEIADVRVHGTNNLSIIGLRRGVTTVRVLDEGNKVLRDLEVLVTYDLPAIRQALNTFLPNETIGIEMVNANIALTGQVSSASAVDRAMRIVREFTQAEQAPAAEGATATAAAEPAILNLLDVTSGQQVMLRVRVGEIQRTALKRLGVSLGGQDGDFSFGSGGFVTDPTTGVVIPGLTGLDSESFAFLSGSFEVGGVDLNATLEALEGDGLFKLLAEPNLVALSGEQAEFLAGGEFPVPVTQGDSDSVSIQFKPFGVAVQFIPYVLSDSRIRLAVQPEVSEISGTNTVINGTPVPSVSTRRAKTTVELAPGESFMIAGLIRDEIDTNIQDVPGLSEIPVLSALFRSTAFQRNETELVIAVTPYLIDPLRSGDVRLPTDNFAPPSQMEMFFYGALGAQDIDTLTVSQTPHSEGPVGFMMD